MIKFFRSIRQRLVYDMSSEASAKGGNKFSKYLLYALGEIILVMVGILSALQVNNCNTNSLDIKLETKYLNNIALDLQKDLKSLECYLKIRRRQSFSKNIL
jgi:hypothetical protein